MLRVKTLAGMVDDNGKFVPVAPIKAQGNNKIARTAKAQDAGGLEHIFSKRM